MDKEWIHSIKGFEKDVMTIGYLDLLGMSQAIMELPIEDVAKKYIDVYLAEKASHLFVGGEEQTGEATPVKYIQFSDSSLFIGGAKTAKDVRLTVAIISGMMTTLLFNCDIVARGAISIGEFCTIQEFRAYMGRPLIEAVSVESSTDWVGLTLLKPPDENIHLMSELKKYDWLSKLAVPIKPGGERRLKNKGISSDSLIALRWFSCMSRQKAEELHSRLIRLADKTEDKAAILKLKNASKFIEDSLTEGSCEGDG